MYGYFAVRQFSVSHDYMFYLQLTLRHQYILDSQEEQKLNKTFRVCLTYWLLSSTPLSLMYIMNIFLYRKCLYKQIKSDHECQNVKYIIMRYLFLRERDIVCKTMYNSLFLFYFYLYIVSNKVEEITLFSPTQFAFSN